MKTIYFFVALFLGFAPLSAHADDIAPFSENMILQLGYFLPEFDSNTRVDNPSSGRGSDLHLEDRLGLDKSNTILWANAIWRFAQNHRLQVGWFEFNRSGDRAIDEQVEIGDKTYPVGAELHTQLNITVVPITYMYSFVQTDQLEFSGIFGLQWSAISFDVIGSTTLGGGADRESSSKANAPLPVLGVDLNYYFTPSWSIGGNLGGFLYKIGTEDMDFQGYVATANISGGYWFSKYIGVGVAVNYFSFNVDVMADKWHGKLQYQYWGPQFYLTGRF